MSTFLKIVEKHQAEIDRMLDEQEHGRPMSYALMRDMGMLKPFAVRLPVPLVACLDEMVKHGLWESKQEMVYDMIQSAYLDFFSSGSDKTKERLVEIQKTAWDRWEKTHKNRDKVFNRSTRQYEERDPTRGPSRRIKVRRPDK